MNNLEQEIKQKILEPQFTTKKMLIEAETMMVKQLIIVKVDRDTELNE